MRAAGSRTQLVMFEYNSEASSKVTDVSDESSILGTIAKPLILLVFFGGTCWLSYSQVKKKRESNRASFASGFGGGFSGRSGRSGLSRGGGFGGGRSAGGFGGSSRKRR